MRQLLWKEWHEQGWKLVLGCIVLSAFAGIGLRTRIMPDESMLLLVCFPAALLMPLLITIGLVPPERSEGSFNTLCALPVNLERIFLVKSISGLTLCVAPLAVSALVSALVAGGRELSTMAMAAMYIRATCTAIMFLAWMMTLTIRLPTEARAAMVCVGILMIWFMLTAAFAELQVGMDSSGSPLSFFISISQPVQDRTWPSLSLDVLINALALLALWGWGWRAIGREELLGE